MSQLSEFKLKSFSIKQSDLGMKVSLDALIFAAQLDKSKKRVLDVGAGTGVLSLVLAQDSSSLITAVEIENFIASVCRSNFEQSPFSQRLSLYEGAFSQFTAEYNGPKFEMIISNPPFFKDSIESKESTRKLARHELEFSYGDILRSAKDLLTENGTIQLLMPSQRRSEILETEKNVNLI